MRKQGILTARVLFPGAYAGSDLQPRMAHAAAPFTPLPESNRLPGRRLGAALDRLANDGRLGAPGNAGRQRPLRPDRLSPLELRATGLTLVFLRARRGQRGRAGEGSPHVRAALAHRSA